MKCAKCGKSVFDEAFMRVNEKGIEGIWWCESCVKKYEPELYKNNIEDGGDILRDLKDICYDKKKLK